MYSLLYFWTIKIYKMKSKLLLPERYKWIGLCLFLPALVLGFMNQYMEFQFDFLTIHLDRSGMKHFLDEDINFTDELALTGLIVGLIFMAFARERHEDEYISKIRLESLQWAVIVNYALLLLATWLVHGFGYLHVMMYNMLTILFIFLVRFHIVLAREKKALNTQ
jgi:hypothetical protein